MMTVKLLTGLLRIINLPVLSGDIFLQTMWTLSLLSPVAQLVASPTADPRVVILIPTPSNTLILSWRLIMK